MTILFRPQGAFGWFSYTTSRDTILHFLGVCQADDVQVASMLRINALVSLSTWTRQLHPEDGANS